MGVTNWRHPNYSEWYEDLKTQALLQLGLSLCVLTDQDRGKEIKWKSRASRLNHVHYPIGCTFLFIILFHLMMIDH